MRCSVCASPRLSPRGELIGSRERVTLQLIFERPGMLQARPSFEAKYGRACLDCGAVVPFLGAGERRRLAAAADLGNVDDLTDRYFDEEADAWIDGSETVTD
jgi:hypothetical protein